MRPNPTPREVFLFGTPFCGSTIFGTALNQHPQIGYAGELGFLAPYYVELNGEKPKTIPICLECGLRNVRCPTWPAMVLGRAANAGSAVVHDFARHVMKKPIVVDGTKLPNWMRLVASRRRFPKPPRVIITARNPFAFMVSALQYYEKRALRAAMDWRDTYSDALSWCAANNIPYLIVRHDDFMLRRSSTMERVCEWLGVDYFDGMAAETYTTNKCSVGGNQGVGAIGTTAEKRAPALKTWSSMWNRGSHGHLDDRWKLGLEPIQLTEALRMHGLADIAAHLGFDITAITESYFADRRPAFQLSNRKTKPVRK
jgi:hypothetical protein